MFIKDEIAYPDPADVKRLRGMYAAAVVGMPALFLCLWPWIDSQISSVDKPEAIRGIFLLMSLAIALPAVAFGIWTFSIYRRVLRAQQWPHPAAKLDRPVPVLRGKKARERARILLVLGSLLAVIGVALGAYLSVGLAGRFENLTERRQLESKSAN